MSVCCECCVLSGRGLWGGPITRPEESYWCLSVVLCVLQVEVSATGRSLVQRSPTNCVPSCVIYKPREWGGPSQLEVVAPKTISVNVGRRGGGGGDRQLLNTTYCPYFSTNQWDGTDFNFRALHTTKRKTYRQHGSSFLNFKETCCVRGAAMLICVQWNEVWYKMCR